MIAVVTGIVGGFVVGLTSVGSGTVFGLVMLIAFPLTAAKIVGTDIFHAAVLLATAGAGHLVAGSVDLGATGWLLIGSVPGVLLGGHFTVRLPDRSLRIVLAATLTLAGVKLVDPPGANTILIGGAVIGAVASGRRARPLAREPRRRALRLRSTPDELAGCPAGDPRAHRPADRPAGRGRALLPGRAQSHRCRSGRRGSRARPGPGGGVTRSAAPPLLVLGVRRSGTTLLRVMLDRSSVLAVPDESYFVPQLAHRHRGHGRRRLLRRRPPADRAPARLGDGADDVAPRLRAGMTAGEAIGAIFETYAALHGKSRWGDKTPLYMQYLPLLERLFPDGASTCT